MTNHMFLDCLVLIAVVFTECKKEVRTALLRSSDFKAYLAMTIDIGCYCLVSHKYGIWGCLVFCTVFIVCSLNPKSYSDPFKIDNLRNCSYETVLIFIVASICEFISNWWKKHWKCLKHTLQLLNISKAKTNIPLSHYKGEAHDCIRC